MRRTSRTALILCLASTASLAQISARNIHFEPLQANCPSVYRRRSKRVETFWPLNGYR
jgi:hypothetical protein